jgi:hypothetical protein
MHFTIEVKKQPSGFLEIEVINIGHTEPDRQLVVDALKEALRMVDIRNMEYKNEHQ